MNNADRCSLAALSAILLIAFALRAGQLGESLWLDELHTAWVVDGALREVPSRAAIGNQSPLYFVLPWATTRAFGRSEVALRLPSLVAGLALVVALYALVWRMTASHAGALLAAWLVAIDPNFLWYSLEARPYAWVQLVGVLQVMAFWQTLSRPTRTSRASLVVLSIVLFYLHYTAALLLLAEVFYFALAKVWWRKETHYSVALAAVDFGIVAVACLPALAQLQAIAARRDAWWKFVRHDPPPVSLLTMFPLSFTVGLPLVIAGVCSAVRWCRRTKDAQEFPFAALLLATMWLCLPLMIVFAATRLEIAPLWLRRYVMVSAAAPLVIAGVLCAAVHGRRWQWAAALAIAVAATWSHGPQRQYRSDGRFVARSTQDWRMAVATINNDAATSDWPVLVRSGFIEADALRTSADASLRAYCLSPVASIYRLNRGDELLVPLPYSLREMLSEAEVAALSARDGFWLITPGNEKTKDAALRGVRLELKRQQRAIAVESAQSFGGVWVVKVRSTEY